FSRYFFGSESLWFRKYIFAFGVVRLGVYFKINPGFVQNVFVGENRRIETQGECNCVRSSGVNNFLNAVAFTNNARKENTVYKFVYNYLFYHDVKTVCKVFKKIVGKGSWRFNLFFQCYCDGLGLKRTNYNW